MTDTKSQFTFMQRIKQKQNKKKHYEGQKRHMDSFSFVTQKKNTFV